MLLLFQHAIARVSAEMLLLPPHFFSAAGVLLFLVLAKFKNRGLGRQKMRRVWGGVTGALPHVNGGVGGAGAPPPYERFAFFT